MDKINRVGEYKLNNEGKLMKIIEYINNSEIIVSFIDTNYCVKNTYSAFKNGSIKDKMSPTIYGIGYIGDGKYKSSYNNKTTKIYNDFLNMMQRCYSDEFHKKNNTYKDCVVCKEWHNFQNFAKWHEENYYNIIGEKMQLDKDIFSFGNKIYSPETCVFVPNNINMLFLSGRKKNSDSPTGVSIVGDKYLVNPQNYSVGYIGYFETKEDAFCAYLKNKGEYIKKIANEYIDNIPKKLYDIMIFYSDLYIEYPNSKSIMVENGLIDLYNI